MACQQIKPVYVPHTNGGILTAVPQNDGYGIGIDWCQAFPVIYGDRIAYNIYYSTLMDQVINEGVKFVSVSTTDFAAIIAGLTPGDLYYFAVRAIEYDTAWYDLDYLPSFEGLKVYPEGLLLSNITESDMILPVSDVDQFPPYGVVQLGSELIYYGARDFVNSTLLVGFRGFLSTTARPHTTDGYDGVNTTDGLVRFWKGNEEENEVIVQGCNIFKYPNFSFTNTDGYKQVVKSDLITDLSASDESMKDFTRYDYSGWHRTNPGDLLRGACIGTYYGGEQFCADGYGVGFQVRGVPFNEENARRQEMLLEAVGTGEPCVLLKRLWTGIVCNCYEPNNEQPKLRCPNCFIPGTLVRTDGGYKPIEKIIVGEKVLSLDGKYHSVTNVFKNHFEGNLKVILPSVSANPIFTTPEHPFYVMRGNHNKKLHCGPKCDNYIKTGDGNPRSNPEPKQLPSGKWHARSFSNDDNKRIVLGSFETKKEACEVIRIDKLNKLKPGHELKWDDAENIKENDWLVAKWCDEIVDINSVEIPQEFRKNTILGSERNGVNNFVIDCEFLWMIGLYIAEGSAGLRAINFSLHVDEIEYQNRIINYFVSKGYGFSVSSGSENGINIAIYSSTLAGWFTNLFGRKCYNKKIPEQFMKLPKNKTWAIIQGIYDGDGNKHANEISQTSEILALQLSELLHRVGESPLIHIQQSSKLTQKGNIRKTAYNISWAEKTSIRNNRAGRWKFDSELLSQVRRVDSAPYFGFVYNLEVEGDHTYVVQGVVVHNCTGVGFVGGYQQTFNERRSDRRILVRFGTTEEDLKQDEDGMDSVLLPDCWTLVYPSLRDRDVLIRFNEDGTEEFRYEILSVSRNKLLNSLSGGQKFKAQRLRRTSPVYSWRAVYDVSTMPTELTTTIGYLAGPGGVGLPHAHKITIDSNNTLSINQINQTTSVVLGHNHPIKNGIVQDSGLGHIHTIIL